MRHSFGRAAGFIRKRWRRVFFASLAVIIGGYGATYAAVETARSEADHRVALPDGRTLAYHVLSAPEAPSARVVLVHGAPADSGSWETLWEAQGPPTGGVEAIAVDRLGYGGSTRGAETSLRAHARSLEPLLADGAVLVGHSYGAPVVLRAAAEYPGRVHGVVLVAGACDPSMNDSQWLRRLLDASGRALPRSWHVANAELLALTDENRAMTDLLPRVRCPVTIVHGRWDPVCPHEGTVAYLRRALVNAASVRVVSLTRAGHNLHLSHPEAVIDALRALTPR